MAQIRYIRTLARPYIVVHYLYFKGQAVACPQPEGGLKIMDRVKGPVLHVEIEDIDIMGDLNTLALEMNCSLDYLINAAIRMLLYNTRIVHSLRNFNQCKER